MATSETSPLKRARDHARDAATAAKSAVSRSSFPLSRRLLIDVQSVIDLHRTLVDELSSLRERVKAANESIEDLVDVGALLRRVSALADDVRKEADGAQRLVDRVACAQWVRDHQNDVNPGPIRGRLAVGSPKVAMVATLPHRSSDPEAYESLLRHIGVSEEVIRAGLVSLHWPTVQEWLSELCAAGSPLPPGIDVSKTHPDFRVDTRCRVDLSGDVDALAFT